MNNQFENFLNLSDIDLDRPIYRVISFERLLEIFENNTNTLVKPGKWDDPFENFILKSKFQFDDGSLVNIEFSDQYYAQCWTLHKASDAMWRIYSSTSQGVRIKTTIRKLAFSLADGENECCNSRCFIGRVEYLSNPNLMKFANNALRGLPTSQKFANTLLVKRPAFKHEREVRLIYFDSGEKNKSDVYAYKIDPNDLIDQIMIDPRLSVTEYKELKERIKHETSFKGEIRRSLIYAPPNEMVFIFG